MQKKAKRIKDLGEFNLIKRIRRKIRLDPSVIAGPGDDCAVLKLDRSRYQLFTCDMLIEGVDFTLKDDPYLIGRKAVAVSVSDIAACCGKPRYCVISTGLPEGTKLKFTDRLFQGMQDTAKKYKLNIVGGDLSRSNKVVIDVSMLGVVEKKNLSLRSAARKGDIIFVTGTLGGSLLGKHLRFTPRVKEAGFLARNFKVNAMTDISDGLAQDLQHILEASKVGAVLYAGLVPLSKEARNLSAGLNDGEDFELLFTLARTEAKKLLRKRLSVFKPVGEIVDKKYGFKLIDKQEKIINVVAQGFRHF